MNTVLMLHADARIGERLRDTLGSEADLRVVGAVASLVEAEAAIAELRPDVVVTDLWLPEATPEVLMRRLSRAARSRPAKLVPIAMTIDDARILDALRGGAHGYFAPGRFSPPLAMVIRQVLAGEAALSPQIARQVLSHFTNRDFDTTDFVSEFQNPLRLSDTEENLLRWTAEGYVPAEVARGLQLSVRGVGLCVANIYRKLAFDRQADELTLLAA